MLIFDLERVYFLVFNEIVFIFGSFVRGDFNKNGIINIIMEFSVIIWEVNEN